MITSSPSLPATRVTACSLVRTGPIPQHNSCPSNLTGDLDISGNVHVTGASAEASVIDGMNTTRIFDVHAGGELWLTDVTLQHGKADWDGSEQHAHGGVIHNHGTLTLERVAVIDSTSTSPTHDWGGGGITNAGLAELVNVTIAGNSTDAQGGGIENKGELRMLNVTITGNSAPGARCVALHPRSDPSGRARSARRPPPCAGTNRGGGIYLAPHSTMIAADALVAKNTSGKDCVGAGSVTSDGGNLQGVGTCGFSSTTDRTGDPGFDSARFGPPLFYPLRATSQAVDTSRLCQYNDIRGALRPQDGNGDGVALCDTGSYELEPGAQPALSIRNARVREGQHGRKTIRFLVSLSASPKHTVKVHAATRDGTARAGSDYVAKSATLIFKPHQRHGTFTVAVIGERKREKDETFTVHLSVPKGARIADAQATGTIVNDDRAPAAAARTDDDRRLTD